MANLVSLNNIDHKNLKINVEYSPSYGHNSGCVLVLPTEFSDVQREYPIFFQKNQQTNKFQAIALLGLTPDENLFLNEGKWNANYIPAVIAKGPFVIGFEEDPNGVAGEMGRVVMVDLDDPRVGEQQGAPLYLEFGGESAYLGQVATALDGIHRGVQVADAMYDTFDQLGLIEPCKLELTLADGEIYRIQGCFAINRERLQSLTAENVAKLHAAGYLEGAYLILASLNNVKKLINIKAARG